MKQDLAPLAPKTLRTSLFLCLAAFVAISVGNAPVSGDNQQPATPKVPAVELPSLPLKLDIDKHKGTAKTQEKSDVATGPKFTKNYEPNFPIDVTELIDVSLSTSLTPKGDTVYIASASLRNVSELTIPGPLFLVIEETGIEGLKLQSTIEVAEGKDTPPHHEILDEDGRLTAGKKTRRHKITFKSEARIEAEELAKFDPTWTVTRERPEPPEAKDEKKAETTFDRMLAEKKYSAADLKNAIRKQKKLVEELTKSGLFPKPGTVNKNGGKPILGNNTFNGVAIGETATGELSFLVFGPRHGLKNQLPETFEGIPVQLRVTAPIFAGPAAGSRKGKGDNLLPIPDDNPSAGPGGNPRIRFDRPVPIGISTSNLTDVCLSGTLGFRAKKRDTGDVMMISNNHVWAKENRAQRGETILQPSRGDSGCSRNTDNSIGEFDSHVNIVFDDSTPNVLDAAMCSVEDGALAGSTPDDGYGFPTETVSQPLMNMEVQKYGRTTGFTKGRIFAINATIRVGYDTGVARFVRQIGYRGSNGVDFSSGGDSGSLVVTDPAREPVALNFAGGGADSFGNPIQDVLDTFNVDVFGEEEEDDDDDIDPPPGDQNPVVQVASNFPGTTFNQSLFIPPDTMGAVGPNQIVELINGQYAVYTKTGALITRSSLDAFWIAAGVNPVRFSFDPRVNYDPFTGRFFACSVDNAAAANNFLVAVSNSSDPADGWTGFSIDADTDDAEWADFPMQGLNADVFTISANMFPLTGGGVNTSYLIIPKADLIAGSVANATLIENVSLNDSGFSPQPAVDLDNGSFPQELLSSFNKPAGTLKTSTILGPAANPTLNTAGGFINVVARNSPPLIDQPGPKVDIQASDNRFNGNVVKQQIPGRTNPSLWGAHTVDIDGRAALEWYEIDSVTNAILQSGTIDDPVLAFNYPSIAVNNNGVVVIGFSGGSPSQFMSTYAIAGRTVSGVTTFDPIILTQAGSADYERLDGRGRNRWGDYSATVVDPTDDNIFWTFQLYCSAEDEWTVNITQLNAGPPGPDPDPGDASIGDRVFVDANQNGIQDAGERGADQVGIELFSVGADGNPQTADDVSIGTTTTNRSGRYRFDNLDAGSYYIRVTTNSSNFTFTTQNAGNDDRRDSDVNDQGISDVVDLAESERFIDLDAGLILANDPGRARIGNLVWADRNQDGIFTSRERGVSGVLVRLFSAGDDGVKSGDDQLIGQRRTNRRGLYVFFGLPAGNYYVEFELPSAATFTTKDQPGRGGDRRDSDADPTTGQTDVFELFPNQTNLNIDAGIVPNRN